jgi:hypothetical protein
VRVAVQARCGIWSTRVNLVASKIRKKPNARILGTSQISHTSSRAGWRSTCVSWRTLHHACREARLSICRSCGK